MGAKKEVVDGEGTLNRVAFLQFIRNHINPDVTSMPVKAGRETGWRIPDSDWMVPPLRYSGAVLVPDMEFYPCNLCAFAKYNTLCVYQKTCAAHAYWGLLRLESMSKNTRSESGEAKHEGRRGKEKGRDGRQDRKQCEDKRVGYRRSYKKPAAEAHKIGGRRR